MGFFSDLFNSSFLELNLGDSYRGEINGEKVTIEVTRRHPDDTYRVVVERPSGETGECEVSLFASSEKVIAKAIENAFSDEPTDESGRSLQDIVEQL